MFQLTYVVYRPGHPQHIPLAVCGRNGNTYGHAMWDPKFQAHVFRFSKEAWEGTSQKEGAMKEVLKRANRGSAIWMVKAEVELSAESPVGQLAADLDAARTDLDDTRRRLEATQAEYAALTEALHKPSVEGVQQFAQARAEADFSLDEPKSPTFMPAQGVIDPIPTPPLDGGGVSGDLHPMAPETKMSTPPPAEELSLTQSRLGAMRFNELQDEAKEQNAKGAKIDLAALNTKAKLRDALSDWHASQSADPTPAA